VIEGLGIPTVCISIVRKYTVETRVPRAAFLRWPMGHPLGEPFHVKQQATVLMRALKALEEIQEPGTIIDLPYRWKRHEYIDNTS
jgi:D-proline reductase (dithiol) PrdB